MASQLVRIYIETSVFGAVFDTEDPERVRLTRAVLARIGRSPYEAFVGTVVLEELRGLPPRLFTEAQRTVEELSPTILGETAATARLVEAYMKAKLVPRKKENDARHIAVATVG